MKHTVVRNIPARKEHLVVSITCDLCGTAINAKNYCKVSYKKLMRETYYDLCPYCFKTKLSVWFDEQDVNPNFEEYE